MKKIIIAMITFVFYTHITAQNFITVWDMNTNGSSNTSISFKTRTSGPVNYTWQSISPFGYSGFGTWNDTVLTISSIPQNIIFRLEISPTNFQSIKIDGGLDKNRLTTIEQWGNINWTSMENAFYGCTKLQITASDVPNLSGVTNMANMFNLCSILNPPSNINNWDISTVTNLNGTFREAALFNQNIGNWNTANVTDMSYLFYNALVFNQDIGNWNTSNVINMENLFWSARQFNQNIGNWNTSLVENMQDMFYQLQFFNHDIGSWNTSKVKNMARMFFGCWTFNQNLNNWITDSVKNMSGMFWSARNFNGNISSWNTSKVTNMSQMFLSAFAFNGDVSNWNTSNVTNMALMFNGANSFNQNLNGWNTSKAILLNDMFRNASAFNQDISNWNTTNVINMSNMFAGAVLFNKNISGWNTANVTNMAGMFSGATAFNQNIGNWNLNSNVNLLNMLNNCGIDCSNYSNMLKAWQTNSNTPNGRSLGAIGRVYSNSALNSRNFLISSKGWTFNGDAVNNLTATIIPLGQSITAASPCQNYVNPLANNQKLIEINENGNNFQPNSIVINNLGNLTGGNDTFSNNETGYYQSTDGYNTCRISKYLYSITATGNFMNNGGILVRLYYDSTQINHMKNDLTPNGNIISFSGWFKFSGNNTQSVINNMSASSLTSASPITPINSGTENGVAFIEFLTTSFSTFGFISSSTLNPLPVDFISFNVEKINKNDAILEWNVITDGTISNFIIEHSNNGISWSFLDTIDNQSSIQKFTYIHYNIENALNYYRIKANLVNNNYKYSSTNLLRINTFENYRIIVFPNPAHNILNISKNIELKTVKIINSLGQENEVTPFNNSIDINYLKKGIFNLKVESWEGAIYIIKFIKL